MDTEQIETVFQRMCEGYKTPRLDLYYTYQATKSRLETRYYPYVKDKEPYMTDHGPGHISRVLEKLAGLLYYHIPSPDAEFPDERLLNLYELNLLLNSVIWHDIGNLYGRIDHPDSIHMIFDRIKGFLYDDHEIEWIPKIARAHSGHGAIERNIEVASIHVHDLPIHPRFLAALLRFADELEEDSRRIGAKVYDDIPDGKKAYWFFCKCNQSVRVVPDLEGCTISVDCKIQKDEVWRELGKERAGGQIDRVIGIEEYTRRLDKINEERKYCNGFVQRYYYYRPVRWLDLELKIYEADSIVDQIAFRFTDSQGYDDFFASYRTRLEAHR